MKGRNIYIAKKRVMHISKVCLKKQKNNNKLWIVGKDSRLCFCFVKYSQLVQFPGSVVIPPSQNKLFAARSRWVGLFTWPSPGPRFQVPGLPDIGLFASQVYLAGLVSYGATWCRRGWSWKNILAMYVHAGEAAQNWIGSIFILHMPCIYRSVGYNLENPSLSFWT